MSKPLGEGDGSDLFGREVPELSSPVADLENEIESVGAEGPHDALPKSESGVNHSTTTDERGSVHGDCQHDPPPADFLGQIAVDRPIQRP